MYKLNTNGVHSKETHMAGVWVVIRDATGTYTVGMAANIGTASNVDAEI